MDAQVITDLPIVAQRVVASHLRRSDAANCRLASKQLHGVSTGPEGALLWVVSNTFRSQLLEDARAAEPSPAVGQVLSGSAYGCLLAATSLARAARRVVRAEVLVDASRPCEPEVWQQLFRSVLSSPTVHDLVVTEYVGQDEPNLVNGLENRIIQAAAGVSWSFPQQPSTCAANSRRSSSSGDGRPRDCPLAAADCAWLPALINAAGNRAQHGCDQPQQQEQQQQTPWQLKLRLQLLAPLLPGHMMQLVPLQCLASLKLLGTPGWLRKHTAPRIVGNGGSQPWPVMGTAALQQLRQLPELRSLSCLVGRPAMGREKPAQVATMLQSLLQDLGPRLTQLSLGTVQSEAPQHRVHYSLSAPFRDMPALQDLTCNLGFSLDAETAADDDVDAAIQQHMHPSAPSSQLSASGTNQGSRPSAAVRPALLPSLTRLVIVDPASVPEVLERLAASDAACSQLQCLELPELMFDEDDEAPDYNEYMDQQQQHTDPAFDTLALLSKLSGLRELQAVVCGAQQLSALLAAVGAQLQGLTLTCELGNLRYLPVLSAGLRAPGGIQVSLQPLFVGAPHLTSLKVVGSSGVLFDPQEDLPVAAKHLTALRQLSYTGRVFTLRDDGCMLLPGMLPSALQGLTVVVRQAAPEGPPVDTYGSYMAHPGCFPQSLTSLKCRGFWWQRPQQVEPWSPWFGWELLPAGLKQLEMDAELAMPGAGPSSILPVSAAVGQGGGVIKGTDSELEGPPELAVQCATAEHPYLAPLPNLESLALYLTANRLAEETDNPEVLSLGALCCHLKGLTALTNLHISSKLKYMAGDGLSALSSLVQVKVLALDVGLPTSSGTGLGQRRVRDEETEFVSAQKHAQALTDDLCSSLASVAGLRVLRLPQLAHAGPLATQRLGSELPNCLLVEVDDTIVLRP